MQIEDVNSNRVVEPVGFRRANFRCLRLWCVQKSILAQVLLVDGPDLAERAVRLLALVGVRHLHRGRVPIS